MEVNDTLENINGAHYNALGFSLRLGRTEIFAFLLEECGAKLEEMEERFKLSGRIGVDIICENGHSSLLQYFLPIYLSNYDLMYRHLFATRPDQAPEHIQAN